MQCSYLKTDGYSIFTDVQCDTSVLSLNASFIELVTLSYQLALYVNTMTIISQNIYAYRKVGNRCYVDTVVNKIKKIYYVFRRRAASRSEVTNIRLLQ